MTATDTPKRRGAPRKEFKKSRQTICISSPILRQAQKNAFEKGMSFSSWLEELVSEHLSEKGGSND